MPKLRYIHKSFREDSLALIEIANDIISEYLGQGFHLTLRQLYYQFVARDLLPNTQRAYKKLGGLVSDGRLAGLIDWDAIEDRTRNIRSVAHWGDPAEIVEACADQFRIEKWRDQPYHCEVWIEKDALIGVIEGVCEEFDVPYFSCRGYVSQSEMWGAAQRFNEFRDKDCLIIHLGDHDPSGIDMTRDIQERMDLFSVDVIEVERIALTADQIAEYSPPPNPAKTTDSRSAGYIALFGEDSWELDALEPAVLARLIRNKIESILDDEKWDAAVLEEDRHRTALRNVADSWEDVVEEFNGKG